MKKLYINQRIGKSVFFLLMLVFIGGNGEGQTAYIANYYDNTVSVIDVSTNTVVATIPVGTHPDNVSVSPDGSKVYITSQPDKTLSIIDAATNTVSSIISLSNHPRGVVVSPDGTKVYVSTTDSVIYVISTTSNSVIATIINSGSYSTIAINPDGTKLYAGFRNSNINYTDYINVISTATNLVIAQIPISNWSNETVLTPDGTKAYVTIPIDHEVDVISTATNTILTVMYFDNQLSGGIAMHPDGSKVYVPKLPYFGDGVVYVINTSSDIIVNSIFVGVEPSGISVSPDGNKLIVTNVTENNVNVINTSTNVVTATISVGTYPYSFGNFISSCNVIGTSSSIPSLNASVSPSCFGNPVTLSISSGTLNNANHWQWYTGSCGGTSIGSGNSITVTPTTSTTYYARGEGTCVAPGLCGSITITVDPAILLDTPTHFNHYNQCVGLINGVIKVNPAGGTSPYSYAWTPSEGTAATISNLHLGTYTVTVTDAIGCTKTNTATITQTHIALTYPTYMNKINACYGMTNGKVNVNPGNGNAPYSYSWTPNEGNHATISNLPVGNYTVTVTDANGCTNSNTATINQYAQIALITPNNINQVNAFCYGAGIINVHPDLGVPPYNYSWSPNVGTTATVSNLIPGSYIVTVTDNIGCTNSATKSIAPAQDLILIGSPEHLNSTLISCYGGSNGVIAATPIGGSPPYSYSWTPSEGTNATISNLSQGYYTVTVTDQNGCTRTNRKLVAQQTQILIGGLHESQVNPTCATGSNGIIRMNPAGGVPPYSYTWSPNIGTTASISNLSAGTYYVTVSDSYGCNSTGGVVMVCTSRLEAPNGSTSSLDFNLYPNPADGIITIVFSSDNENSYSIKLIDIMGRVVKTETDNASIGGNTHIMNIEGIAMGIYIVELRIGDGFNKVKLVVQ